MAMESMKKEKSSINKIFNKYLGDKKKRWIATLIIILPLFVVIVILGFSTFTQAKDLIGMAMGGSNTTDANYSISSYNFVLRANATDIQKEYFDELKNMYESTETVFSANDKAMSTVKNFVADFYTWSNKQGQYDVGGMYYVYEPQRETIYIQARDQFYKYINKYINDYGVENLLEVESVNATSVGSEFAVNIDEQEFKAYNVSANWTYVNKKSSFSLVNYDTKAYFTVIDNNNRFEIIYAGKDEYKIEQVDDDVEASEDSNAKE